jgi:hypothetical protein
MWMAQCKSCGIHFPITKDNIHAAGKLGVGGELEIVCTTCGVVGEYLATDLVQKPAEQGQGTPRAAA